MSNNNNKPKNLGEADNIAVSSEQHEGSICLMFDVLWEETDALIDLDKVPSSIKPQSKEAQT